MFRSLGGPRQQGWAFHTFPNTSALIQPPVCSGTKNRVSKGTAQAEAVPRKDSERQRSELSEVPG